MALRNSGVWGRIKDNIIENNTTCISAYGLSDRIIKSDYAKLRISIINETDSLKDIQEKRKTDRELIEDFLLECGFESHEIRDGSIDITDRLSSYEKDNDRKRYKIVDTIVVETKNVDLMSEASTKISELVDKGIFIDSFMRYLCKDINKFRLEMINEVTRDSRNMAELIAKSSEGKITGGRDIKTGKFSISAEDSSSTFEAEPGEGEGFIMKRFGLLYRPHLILRINRKVYVR